MHSAKKQTQRLAGDASDQGTEYLTTGVVDPPLARLRDQRQRTKPSQSVVHPRDLRAQPGPLPPSRYSRISFSIG
jgi:hypothetical protein